MAVYTIGPTQAAGSRTIADANALTLVAGDVVKFEAVDDSGYFTTTTRLLIRAGVTYESARLGHKWGIRNITGGLDIAGAGTITDYAGDGQSGAAAVGIQTTLTLGAVQGLTLQRYELRNYPGGGIRSIFGQRKNYLDTGEANVGPDDSGWNVSDGLHVNNGSAGVDDWSHFGSGLVFDRVAFRATGLASRALTLLGRGARGTNVLLDACVAGALSPRCGDTVLERIVSRGTPSPIQHLAHDRTALGGYIAIVNMEVKDATSVGAVVTLDAGSGADVPLHDVLLANITILDSYVGASDFDFAAFTTTAHRRVKIRNVAHGKNSTAPHATGADYSFVDADYNAYPNGGRLSAGTASPLVGVAADPSTLGLTSQELVDTLRELKRQDLSGRPRPADYTLWTVGAAEAWLFGRGTSDEWTVQEWNAAARYLRVRYMSSAGAGTGDGSSAANAMSVSTGFSTSNANRIVPGDDVKILDGQISRTSTIFYHNGGTATNPVRLRAINKGKASIVATASLGNSLFQFSTTSGSPDANWLVIEGIVFDGGGDASTSTAAKANLGLDYQNGTHHVALRDVVIKGCRENGIEIRQGDYRRVERCDVWRNGIGSTSHPSGLSFNVGQATYVSDGYTGVHDVVTACISTGSCDDFLAWDQTTNPTGTGRTDGNGSIADAGRSTNPRITVPTRLECNCVFVQNAGRGQHDLYVEKIIRLHNVSWENNTDLTNNANSRKVSPGFTVYVSKPAEYSNQGAGQVLGSLFSMPYRGNSSFPNSGSANYFDTQPGDSTVYAGKSLYYGPGSPWANSALYPSGELHSITDPVFRSPPARLSNTVTAAYLTAPDPSVLRATDAFRPLLAQDAHSVTPASLTVDAATGLPTVGSALIGAGTAVVDAVWTPPVANIGYVGAPPPPATVQPVTIVELQVVGTGSSALPGGTLPGALADYQPGDVIVYALAYNQLALVNLSTTPPAGYTVRASRQVTNSHAAYVATHVWAAGDSLTLPTWHLQDSTPTDQPRSYICIAAVYRGVNQSGPLPASGATSGSSSTAATSGNSGTTAIATLPNAAVLIGFVATEPSIPPPAHTLDAANSVPTTGWVKRCDFAQGAGTGGVSFSAYSQTLAVGATSQVKIAATFGTAEWAALAIELRPASQTGDVTPPDVPQNLRTTTPGAAPVVEWDASDFGGLPPPPPPSFTFADPGPPSGWWQETQKGGLRPSPTAYDPKAIFGPQTRAYYDNASLRAQPRGTPISNSSVRYWPRVLGLDVQTIDFSDPAHFKVSTDTSKPAPNATVYGPGKTVVFRDPTSSGGSAGNFDKSPQGTYVVQSISGRTITFTTGAKTTKGTYATLSGFVCADSLGRQETVWTINVTEATIAGASDAVGPLFLPKDPSNPVRNTPTNPWVLQPGFCNDLTITGNTNSLTGGGQASLCIEIPPWFDVVSASTEMAKPFDQRDPQLFNPYCTHQVQNCHVNVTDGFGTYGLCGGSNSYTTPLGRLGLYVPTGGCSNWKGCSGVIRGWMHLDSVFDSCHIGSGTAKLRFRYCANFRARPMVASGGGHTDGYTVVGLDNHLLEGISWTDDTGVVWATEPSFYRCYFEAGGNAMMLLSEVGSGGGGVIRSVYALECIAGTGNKFWLANSSQDTGPRRCLINGDPGTPVRPDPLDYGDNDGTLPCSPDGNHPCPRGNLIWPDPSVRPDLANYAVNADGSTTPIDRPIDASVHPCLESNGCFTFVN